MCFALVRIDERNGGEICKGEEVCNEIFEIAGVLSSQPLNIKIGSMSHVAAEINKKDFKVSKVVKDIKKIDGVIAVKVLDGVDWIEEK